VLGVRPTAKLPHLPSDRARVDARGIAAADLCLVPLEDGDRAEALRRAGKRVISIDLNPLSRTSRAADLPVVDELRRALRAIAAAARSARGAVRTGRFPPFDAPEALAQALGAIDRRLRQAARRPRRRPRR
jgi:4-phosphopantoate---beta-alanine ligase